MSDVVDSVCIPLGETSLGISKQADGDILIEFITKEFRIGLSTEKGTDLVSWYLVTSERFGHEGHCGYL